MLSTLLILCKQHAQSLFLLQTSQEGNQCTTKKKGSGRADCPNIYTVLKGMHDVLKNLSSSPTFDNLKLDANTFRQILAENIVFVTKAFKNRLVIPDFEVFCKNITRLVRI